MGNGFIAVRIMRATLYSTLKKRRSAPLFLAPFHPARNNHYPCLPITPPVRLKGIFSLDLAAIKQVTVL